MTVIWTDTFNELPAESTVEQGLPQHNNRLKPARSACILLAAEENTVSQVAQGIWLLTTLLHIHLPSKPALLHQVTSTLNKFSVAFVVTLSPVLHFRLHLSKEATQGECQKLFRIQRFTCMPVSTYSAYQLDNHIKVFKFMQRRCLDSPCSQQKEMTSP